MKDGHMLNETIADKYAIRLGMHPSNIWPDWFSHEPEGGSNPKFGKKAKSSSVKGKKSSKDEAHIVYIDTTQPQDYNQ